MLLLLRLGLCFCAMAHLHEDEDAVRGGALGLLDHVEAHEGHLPGTKRVTGGRPEIRSQPDRSI